MPALRTSSLLMVLLITGCYRAVHLPPPMARDMPVKLSHDGVTVAADPYGEVARQKAAFGQNLRNRRIIALRVLVRNDSASPVLVRLFGITLKPPFGEELFPVQPEIATDVFRTRSEVHGVDPFSLMLGLVVITANAVSEGTAHQQAGDYRKKELSEVTLTRGTEAHGFVFFRPPGGTPAFDEAILNFRVVDAAALRTSVLPLPLTGVNFRGWNH